MMRTLTLLIFITACLSGFGQLIKFDKENITPAGVTEIGGVGYYNDQLYLLLPANIRYVGKTAVASESKSIAQKYRVWDIFLVNDSTGELENVSKTWPTPDASPNGFCIVDDTTVVYSNNKSQLVSNNPIFNTLVGKVNNSKYHFTDPAWDNQHKQLYFASERPGGKGGMDVWHIETEGSNPGLPVNAGSINSTANELSPTLPNDTILLFVSNRKNNSYDIQMYDQTKEQIVATDNTPGINEFFTIAPHKGLLYYIATANKKQSLWKGSWTNIRQENIEQIAPAQTKEIPIVEKQPEPELVKPAEIPTDDPDFRLTNYFGLAKYDLTPLMKDSLNKIAEMLNQNPTLNIVICGHASPDGPENLNMMLSYYRANEAYKWLLSKNVTTNRIFRIYGGEYLYTDSVQARMFSIFPVKEAELPKQTVVIPKNMLGDESKLYPQYKTDSDETDYWRFILQKQLPVDEQSLILLPVKDIHYVLKGETIYSLAKQFGSTPEKVIKANNMKDESMQHGSILFLPGK